MKNDRAETFERFCCAVENYQNGQREQVTDYLRDIEARLGRDIAERVKTSVLACSKSHGWLRDVEKLRVKPERAGTNADIRQTSIFF
jgi:hypothetical protein